VWNGLPCARSYNLYRMTYAQIPDANGDGLADDYGQCLQPGLAVAEATDLSVPPAGQAHDYLVTAENPLGEGSMGFNSGWVERPNAKPCP